MKRVKTTGKALMEKFQVMELSSLAVLMLFRVSSGASRSAEVGESNGKDKGT